MTAEVDADVAIVGAGPVGTALAILLGQLGRRVVVLERQPQPYLLPRAVHFDDEIGRVLQACGIGAELAEVSEPAEVYEWRNATGTTLLRFGRRGLGRQGWPQSSMFNQPALEGLLAERAAALPTVDVRRGVEVTGLQQAEHHVVLSTGDGPITARWVVGCDGANSTVRSLLEAEVVDLGFFHDWLIVDVVLREERAFDPINVQICDPARPSTAVSGGPGRRRWEFMRLPHESLADLDTEEAAWAFLEPWDVRPDNATIERRALYTFQARYAEAWRHGRVFLAGDAAHQMPPFAGQGMCSGLRDVANLAWKLDLVLDGRAAESILDTYGEERRENVQAVIAFSMELGKVICVPDPVEAGARDEAMALGVVEGEVADVGPLPGLAVGIRHPSSPHAGEAFPQLFVDGARFDDVHGAGWRLVCAPPVAAALEGTDEAAWFTTIGGAVVGLDDPWFAEHETAAALQRPDFHLFGTATDAAEAAALLTSLRAALA